MSGQPTASRQNSVAALQRGLGILQMFRSDRLRIKVIDIERELAIPRATAYRLVRTLEAGGFLIGDPESNTFCLGPRVLKLGFEFLHQQGHHRSRAAVHRSIAGSNGNDQPHGHP